MESGIVTTYKNKGIITPELISLPFFFEVFKYLFKNRFSDKFFLRAFIFPHAKFLKAKSRKYQGVFEVKSRIKTWEVREIWSQQLEH